MVTGRRPTHELHVKRKDSPDQGVVGVAWENDKRLVLDSVEALRRSLVERRRDDRFEKGRRAAGEAGGPGAKAALPAEPLRARV